MDLGNVLGDILDDALVVVVVVVVNTAGGIAATDGIENITVIVNLTRRVVYSQ